MKPIHPLLFALCCLVVMVDLAILLTTQVGGLSLVLLFLLANQRELL